MEVAVFLRPSFPSAGKACGPAKVFPEFLTYRARKKLPKTARICQNAFLTFLTRQESQEIEGGLAGAELRGSQETGGPTAQARSRCQVFCSTVPPGPHPGNSFMESIGAGLELAASRWSLLVPGKQGVCRVILLRRLPQLPAPGGLNGISSAPGEMTRRIGNNELPAPTRVVPLPRRIPISLLRRDARSVGSRSDRGLNVLGSRKWLEISDGGEGGRSFPTGIGTKLKPDTGEIGRSDAMSVGSLRADGRKEVATKPRRPPDSGLTTPTKGRNISPQQKVKPTLLSSPNRRAPTVSLSG